MKLGSHISKSGSMDSWLDNAIGRECSEFQVCNRSPRGWYAQEWDVYEEKSKKKKHKQ